MTHALVVRLDSLGDMIVCGPAIRAVANCADRVTVLAGPAGAPAARLLPGVDDVLVWACPWIAADPQPVQPSDIADIVAKVAGLNVDEAVVLTSFHQSALPTALVLRLAGVPRIAAVSTDYPGSLVDTRLPEPPEAPEPQRMLTVAVGAGAQLPAGDDGRLRLRALPEPAKLPADPFLVVHPGVSTPARAYPPERWADVVGLLTAAGWTVVVTGSGDETTLTARIAAAQRLPGQAIDCGGGYELPQLAVLLRRAAAVVVGNTGPAHVAAAVGTPVVSLFAPVVPAVRWAPYGTRTVLLGDQHAPCRGSRARRCPVEGHPCLSSVDPAEVVAAATRIAKDVCR